MSGLGLYGIPAPNKRENSCGWLSKLGSLIGSLFSYGTYYLGYPTKDHNFDNHPCTPFQRTVIFKVLLCCLHGCLERVAVMNFLRARATLNPKP